MNRDCSQSNAANISTSTKTHSRWEEKEDNYRRNQRGSRKIAIGGMTRKKQLVRE